MFKFGRAVWDAKQDKVPSINTAGIGTDNSTQLLLYFGSSESVRSPKLHTSLAAQFPNTHIVGCSTGGSINRDQILEDEVVCSWLQFDKTRLGVESITLAERGGDFECGKTLAQRLKKPDLTAVFILSDGLNVNGTELVRGFTEVLGKEVVLTGGLAGDGDKFVQTFVGANAPAESKRVVAIGFYGKNLQVGYGSMGGWDDFGPARIITRSVGNVLYELDSKPALDLYKKYLGEESEKLPGSALLFPLSVHSKNSDEEVVRTVLAVNEQDKSMTFAGDMPEGAVARLMKGNFDRLVDGAKEAALHATAPPNKPDCAILISCIGRKLLMGQRVVEEIDSVSSLWKSSVPIIGYYSYGEISPGLKTGVCDLHNQTMTVTTFTEK